MGGKGKARIGRRGKDKGKTKTLADGKMVVARKLYLFLGLVYGKIGVEVRKTLWSDWIGYTETAAC